MYVRCFTRLTSWALVDAPVTAYVALLLALAHCGESNPFECTPSAFIVSLEKGIIIAKLKIIFRTVHIQIWTVLDRDASGLGLRYLICEAEGRAW